jgi:hypothetical protein
MAFQREGLSSDLDEEDEESFNRQEVEEKIHKEDYQSLEEEQELPRDFIEDNGDLIEEREPEEVNHEEDYQEEHELPGEYAEEEHFDETHLVEDLIHEEAPHEDEASVLAPSFDEAIQASIPLAHGKKNVVSYTHFQNFDDALFYDSKNEEVIEEPLDALDPSCFNKGDDVIKNIDEFILLEFV